MDIIRISTIVDSYKLEINGDIRFVKSEDTLGSLFERLAQSNITNFTKYKDKDLSSISFGNVKCYISNYHEICKLNSFMELSKKINLYKAKMIAKKVFNKKLVVIGSIVGTVMFTGATEVDNPTVKVDDEVASIETYNIDIKNQIFTLDLIEEQEKENTEEINYDTTIQYVKKTPVEISDEEDIDPLSDDIGYIQKLDEEIIETDDSIIPEKELETSNVQEEIVHENEDDVSEKAVTITNIDDVMTDNFVYDIDTDYSNFESLKDFISYEQYIKFAANLYGVDLNKAMELVKNNFSNFTTPGKAVNEHYAQEMDRMKDLVSRGLINGDLNVIGIFLTIKDYAIDVLDLSNQAPILSNKTPKEREKDVAYIAKYIYGVENVDLQNIIIATMRIESGSGTSKAAINKNNIGGNMSSKGSFEHPVLNTYKTAEIGAESFVRNFLNCYGKSLVAHNYDLSMAIPTLMKDKLCPHTPNEWEKTITGEMQNVAIKDVFNSYLNESNQKKN